MTAEESPIVANIRGLVDMCLGTEFLPNIADVHTDTPVQKNVEGSIHCEADKLLLMWMKKYKMHFYDSPVTSNYYGVQTHISLAIIPNHHLQGAVGTDKSPVS